MKMRTNLINQLASKGNTFTFQDAQNILGSDYAVTKVILSRLEKRGWIERIEKGKYMIIPLGAEKGKYTLNEFVIGSLLVKPYAIAYWSALHFYGLTEQIPNTVFMQTTSRKKKQVISVFDVNYKIVRVRETKFFGIRKEWIEESQINITDREKTVIDCLDKPKYCGGVLEVAKALKNGKLDRDKLVMYADKIGNSGVIRRLGFLCELIGIEINLSGIETKNYLYLDPTMPQRGKKDARWKLIVNLEDKILGALE
jgi:predicted transcriptional regulator of viral defense system